MCNSYIAESAMSCQAEVKIHDIVKVFMQATFLSIAMVQIIDHSPLARYRPTLNYLQVNSIPSVSTTV